ncbi:MAG: UvrD-helicase domain-containing protein [Gemmatimonadota bacterium]
MSAGGSGPRQPARRAQWNAVRALDGHVLVTAGAGTGKTYTVVTALLYLLGVEVQTPDGPARTDRPLDLHEIAAITFTNQAAADLKSGLREALRAHGRADLARRVDGARVGTIHRFCGDVLREFALRTGRDPSLRVLDEGEAAALIRSTAREALVDAAGSAAPDVADLLARRSVREVERWIAELLSDSDVLARLRRARDLDPDARALVGLAATAGETLERELDEAGTVDFDRMIAWTRNLLRDDPRALRTLRRRIRVLIIDEFQDVDPVQKDIAYRLGGLDLAAIETVGQGGFDSSGVGLPVPLPPSAVPSRAPDNVTRLFLVGDPKQSIYRFRGADVSVWTRVERDFRSGRGTVVPLDESFRSTPEILGWVDATSGEQLDEPVDGEAHADFEIRYLPLSATRAIAGEPAVEVLLLPAGEDGKPLPGATARRAEARWIARRARAEHDAGTRWRDMAILLSTWTDLAAYEEALKEAGVPVYSVRGEGLLERREVVDMILALQAVRTPRDDRALFGFLRSPFVGVRDDTLLRIARHAGRPYWRALAPLTESVASSVDESGGLGTLAALAPTAEEATRLASGVRLLKDLDELRDRVPTTDLLEDLLDRTGYLAHLALAGSAGMQAVANVRRFLALARAASDRSVGDFLADVAERRQRDRDGVARQPPARLYAADDDVLTISTVHGAKGLEWSVVFWADIARPPPSDRDQFLRVGDGLFIGDPDVPSDERPQPFQDAAHRLHAEARAEAKRQWYVAQTRARDRLILTGIPLGQRPRSGTFARELTEAFEPLGDALKGGPGAAGETLAYRDRAGAEWSARVAVVADADVEAEAGATTATAELPPPDPLVPSPAEVLAEPPPALRTPAGPLRFSATQLLARERCQKRHWFKYVLQVPEPDIELHAGDDALIRGVVRGRIVHEVLERYRDPEELADVIEAAIGRWDEHAPPPETDRGAVYRAELRGEVDRVLSEPGYAELREAPGARRELPFLRVHADGRSTQGAIDLAAPPGGDAAGWRLLDVKTNRLTAPEAGAAVAHYRPQRDVYVDATAALSGEPVDAFTFVFSAPGVAVREEALDATEAAERCTATRAAIASGGEPRLADDPAECVFCGYRLVGMCPGVGRGPGADTPFGVAPAALAPAFAPAREAGSDIRPTPPQAERAAPAREVSGEDVPPRDSDGQLSLF